MAIRSAVAGVLLVAVLWGGFFFGAVNEICEASEPEWPE